MKHIIRHIISILLQPIILEIQQIQLKPLFLNVGKLADDLNPVGLSRDQLQLVTDPSSLSNSNEKR